MLLIVYNSIGGSSRGSVWGGTSEQKRVYFELSYVGSWHPYLSCFGDLRWINNCVRTCWLTSFIWIRHTNRLPLPSTLHPLCSAVKNELVHAWYICIRSYRSSLYYRHAYFTWSSLFLVYLFIYIFIWSDFVGDEWSLITVTPLIDTFFVL